VPSKNSTSQAAARGTKPRRLGRGLSSLLNEPVAAQAPSPASGPEPIVGGEQPYSTADAPEADGPVVRSLAIHDLAPGPRQPRRTFSESDLEALAGSIRTAGVMQPVLVRRPDAGTDSETPWEIVAGERRWRAAKLAGLSHIPAIAADISEQEAAEWSLVENLQRVDLDPMERAWAFRALQEDFGLTQDQIAERVALDRSSVSNHLRLLSLEQPIQLALAAGELSFGHAKALLSVAPGRTRERLAKRAQEGGWSVRRLEREANQASPSGASTGRSGRDGEESPQVRDLERRLGESLGTKAEVRTKQGGKQGRIVLHFYDLDHFEGLMQRLGVARD